MVLKLCSWGKKTPTVVKVGHWLSGKPADMFQPMFDMFSIGVKATARKVLSSFPSFANN